MYLNETLLPILKSKISDEVVSTSSDYASWLYCSSINCGKLWWIMGTFSGIDASYTHYSRFMSSVGIFGRTVGNKFHDIRPVITIVK